MAIMAVWLMPTLALAEPRLEGSFGSHMVLQREKPIKLKGSAKAGEEITVEFAGQKKSAKADGKGRWTITLDPLKASKKPQTMVIKEAAGKPIELEDVLVGDVWFGSGQSNMAFSVDHCDNDVKDPQRRDKALAEIAAGSHPLVRLYRGGAKWVTTGPEVNRQFSGLMLAFGVALQRELDVPVGLSVLAKSANPSKSFLSQQQFEADPECRTATERARNSPDAATAKAQRDRLLADWKQAAQKAKDAGQAEPPMPKLPSVPGEVDAPGLFGGSAIGHLQGLPIRGVLWDQGESGSGLTWVDQYTMMGALIRGWRQELGQGEFPFLYIQKPSGGGCAWDPSDPVTRYADAFAPLPKVVPDKAVGGFGMQREEYLRLRQYPNTFLVTSSDLGGGTHPICKSGYGARAARVALGAAYGRKVEIYGPVYESHKVEGSKVRVKFTHVGQGLAFKHGDRLQGFALAGADKQFHWADAVIDGDTVVVSSLKAPAPVTVRYAWAGSPAWANLFNKDGLPALSFRTDNWVSKKTE